MDGIQIVDMFPGPETRGMLPVDRKADRTDMGMSADAGMAPMHEQMPATHPVAGTAMDHATGAGSGTVRKGMHS